MIFRNAKILLRMQWDASPGEVTQLLNQLRSGKRQAEAELLRLIYGELRRLARGYMRRERADHTLQPTELVHQAYLRLLADHKRQWENRAHFYAIAANAMRQILVDYARRRNAAKRGAGRAATTLSERVASAQRDSIDIMALDQALERLAKLDREQSQIVEWHYFAGMTLAEIAEVLGVSTRTVKRQWAAARTWLFRELGGGRSDDTGAVASSE